jgi:hypothetical protein
MKKTITLLLVLLTIVSAHSQNFFETIIPPIDGVFREAQHAAETEDHGYIVTCVAHDLGDTDMILSIGPDGQVRNSFVEQIQDKNPKYCTLFRHPDQDDTYVIIAVLSLGGHNCSDYTQNTMAFLRVDGNLNIISRNFLEFGDDWLKLGYRYGYNENWLPKFVMEDDGTLSMAAHCLKTDGWRYVFARLTLDGTIIQMKEDQTMIIGVDFMYDFFVRNKSNGSYGLIKYCQNELGGYYYYNVESDFTSNMVVKRLCGMELKRIPENVQIPDSTYYLGTNDIKISPTICCYNDSIMLMSHTSKVYDRKGHSWNCQFVTTIDDSLNVGDMIVWHKKNMSEMSPMTHSMSISDDAIYCGAILGMDKHSRKTTATINSTTIMLTKFDKDLHQIWSRYYEGNDMFYDLNSVMATDDGGCIMTGVCSKKDSYHTFYTYILKVDADGYDAIAENAEQTVKPYHCYPNPTSDRIFIDISPDVECTRIDVYAIDGRLLQSQSSDFETVDMSNLEPGIYIIKVRLADGREYAERVVRE